MNLSAHQACELNKQRRDLSLTVTECLLQLLSHGLHLRDSKIAGNALHGMGDAFSQFEVATFERG